MKVTSYTNYELRPLQWAALSAQHLSRVDDVANVHKLSRPHITRIDHELGKVEYVETVRGRNGSFRPARWVEQIVVSDVLRITKNRLDIVECFNRETNRCPHIGDCKLSRTIMKSTDVFMVVFGELTIADIASNKSELLDCIRFVEGGFGVHNELR